MLRAYLSRPWLAAAAWLAVAALSAVVASQLRFDASYERLLDPRSDTARELARARAAFGATASELVVVVEGPATDRQAYAERAVRELRGVDGVDAVSIDGGGDWFADRALWMIPLDDLRALVRSAQAGELWQGRAAIAISAVRLAATGYADDPQRTRVFVRPSASAVDVDRARALVAAIDDRLASAPAALRVDIAGRPAVHIAEQDATGRDLSRATLVAAIAIALLLVFALGMKTAPVVVGLPVVVSLAITLAVARVLFGELNILSGFALPALLGLGVDAGIHVASRMRDLAAGGVAGAERGLQAVRETATPALLSASTTAIGFGSLLVIDVPGARELGAVGALGALAGAICALGLVPILANLAMGSSPQVRPSRSIAVPRRGLGIALVVGLALTAVAGAAASQVRFVTDFTELSSSAPAVRRTAALEESLGGILSPAAAVVPTLEQAGRFAELARSGTDRRPVAIRRVVGAADALPPADEAARRERATLLSALRRAAPSPRPPRLDAALTAQPWGFDELPSPVQRRLTAAGGGYVVYLWPDDPLHRADRMADWSATLDRLSASASGVGIEATIFDERRASVAVVSSLSAGLPLALVLGLAMLLVVLVVVSRSPRLTASVLLAAAATAAWLLAALAVTDLHLNVYSAIVLPVILGLSIDNALHILYAARRQTIGRVLATTGRAAALASLTTAIGFGAVITADQGGLRSLGTTALLGVAASFAVTTVALPMVIAWRARAGGSSE